MLNVTFTGNTLIECYYQLYFEQANKYSNIRTTELQQYNINAGDSDCLTQDGNLVLNTYVYLIFWTGTQDKLTLNKFCYFKIKYDNKSTYVNNIQLQGKSTISNTISASYTTVDKPVVFSTSVNLFNTYTYNSIIFYQDPNFFPIYVTSRNISYGDNLNGTDNSHNYTNVGSYNITYTITTSLNQTATSNTNITLKYPKPIDTITYTPTSINVGNTIKVSSVVNNLKNNLINIKRYINNNLINENNLSNNTTNYNLLNYVSTIDYKDEIYWFDGIDNQVDTVSISIPIESRPPTIHLTNVGISNNEHSISNEYTSIDGIVEFIQWELYYAIQKYDSQDIVEILIYQSDKLSDFSNLNLILNHSGQYIVKATVFDSNDNTATDSVDFNVICENGGSGTIYIRNDTNINIDIVDIKTYDELVSLSSMNITITEADTVEYTAQLGSVNLIEV